MPLPLFLGIAAAAAAGAKVVKTQVEKNKAADAVIEEAETRCAKEALACKVSRTETDIQKNMRKLLLETFPSYEKEAEPPISSDWKHLPVGTKSLAACTYSFIPWKEYSFYTSDAIYYHNRKEGIHEFLYYDNINDFDSATNVVDYGNEHSKRCVSQWPSTERKFIEQISRLWKVDSETDTSIFEFCFNSGRIGFKAKAFQSELQRQSQKLNAPKVVAQNFDRIKVESMENGVIELRFWDYFPKVQNVVFNANDTEDDIREKEWEQERRIQEAEDREREAQDTFETLIEQAGNIARIFQKAVYAHYGVKFKKENIIFMEEPDFTYEGPSFLDKLESATNTVQNTYSKMADITQKRMDEARRDYERKNKG